ncbi:hypothetical protein CCYA_CCYA10G2908 [Cyanidiococcus yangmingshanensis]|nr:hypothetical protein CCYA_CCYA10G2908 [Cyanidiococcus yangmingshanensis]
MVSCFLPLFETTPLRKNRNGLSSRRPKLQSPGLNGTVMVGGEPPKTAPEAYCKTCGGSGRLQGGLAAWPGFRWWPIKAYRPCPACDAGRLRYQRQGQSLQDFVGRGNRPPERDS